LRRLYQQRPPRAAPVAVPRDMAVVDERRERRLRLRLLPERRRAILHDLAQ
jgi:hypothetical protein